MASVAELPTKENPVLVTQASILARPMTPERRMADAIRALAIDAVEKARSGHPGNAPASNWHTTSIEGEKSSLHTGPSTAAGLTDTNSIAPPLAATQSRAARSAMVLDLT